MHAQAFKVDLYIPGRNVLFASYQKLDAIEIDWDYSNVPDISLCALLDKQRHCNWIHWQQRTGSGARPVRAYTFLVAVVRISFRVEFTMTRRQQDLYLPAHAALHTVRECTLL